MRRQKIEGGMDVKGSVEGRGKNRKAVAWLKAKGDCGRKDCVIHTMGGKVNWIGQGYSAISVLSFHNVKIQQ